MVQTTKTASPSSVALWPNQLEVQPSLTHRILTALNLKKLHVTHHIMYMNMISGSKRYHVQCKRSKQKQIPWRFVQNEASYHQLWCEVFEDVQSLKTNTHRRRPTCVKASAAITFYVLTDTGGSHTALHTTVVFIFSWANRCFFFLSYS